MPSKTRDSPPPSPPATLAPGIRAAALQKNFDQALIHTLRACSYSNFAACFPTPAEHVPEALIGLHREFIGKLEQVCQAELNALVEERNVIPSLNELDSLIIDARKRLERFGATGTPESATPPDQPHLLPPKSLMGAHLFQFLTSQTKTLESQLDATQMNSRELAAEVASQRTTIEGLILALETVLNDVEAAADVLGGDDMAGIDNELYADVKSSAT